SGRPRPHLAQPRGRLLPLRVRAAFQEVAPVARGPPIVEMLTPEPPPHEKAHPGDDRHDGHTQDQHDSEPYKPAALHGTSPEQIRNAKLEIRSRNPFSFRILRAAVEDFPGSLAFDKPVVAIDRQAAAVPLLRLPGRPDHREPVDSRRRPEAEQVAPVARREIAAAPLGEARLLAPLHLEREPGAGDVAMVPPG